MYQEIGGLINNLIPFGIFLFLTLELFGIIKLNTKPKFLEKPPKYLKFIALIGLISFSILIITDVIK